MCGIYGTTRRYSTEVLNRKLNRISFRGPDYSRIKHYEKIVLGHNRLSIIDLNERSNQPFDYENLSITFNGEIYNFEELKDELEKKGYQFSTHSDTEVICAAYKAYGPKCVSRFNGMFAFVIFDASNQILFGARDRVGQKPFYYSLQNREFEFASQPSCLAIGNNFSINESAVSQVLTWKYIPEPHSIYNEVSKLKAGHFFIYNLVSRDFKQSQYWEIPDNYFSFKGSYNEAVEALGVKLGDAVEKRMIADVPLGVFLSGGIDSSLIAALAQERSMNPINTFSIKFEEDAFDESPFAQKVANIIHTNHQVITCSKKEGLELIENYGYYFDEPFSDSSAIPTMLLSKYTKKEVTVALSGDGGDENFLGYHTYEKLAKRSHIFNLPMWLRNILVLFQKPFLEKNRWIIASQLTKLPSAEKFHYNQMKKINNFILRDEKKSDFFEYDYMYQRNKPLLEKASDFDFKMFVAGDANTKVDRASMAFSLEVRSPFYDPNVIEFSRSIPTKFKFSNGIKKRILKDLLKNYSLDDDFLNRKKAGFTMPFTHWFRNELKETILDELTNNNISNVPNISLKGVNKIITEHMSGSHNHYPAIWSLFVVSRFLNNRI